MDYTNVNAVLSVIVSTLCRMKKKNPRVTAVIYPDCRDILSTTWQHTGLRRGVVVQMPAVDDTVHERAYQHAQRDEKYRLQVKSIQGVDTAFSADSAKERPSVIIKPTIPGTIPSRKIPAARRAKRPTRSRNLSRLSSSCENFSIVPLSA